MKNEHFNENFEDRLRAFAEECDYMQGFHIFLDAYNGFGGLTENILELISEEYSKKTVLSLFSFPYFENQVGNCFLLFREVLVSLIQYVSHRCIAAKCNIVLVPNFNH